MKMDKLSERDLKALLALGMLAIVALAYFFGFQILLNSARTVKAENMQLETRLADLQAKDANKQQILDETEEFNAEIDKIVAMFPSEMTTEKAIVDLENIRGKLGKAEFGTETFLMNNLFYPVADSTTTDTSTDTTTDTTSGDTELGYSDGVITVYQSTVTVSVTKLTYAALKTLISEVQNYDGRLSVDSMNISYSQEDGLLSGQVIFDFYALEGSPNEYKVPDVSGVSSGVDDVFGTFSK